MFFRAIPFNSKNIPERFKLNRLSVVCDFIKHLGIPWPTINSVHIIKALLKNKIGDDFASVRGTIWLALRKKLCTQLKVTYCGA
jgi:hypothetical protein